MANLPRIALILTGGTIDSVGKDRLDLAWYIEAGKRLGDGELLQQLPELKEIAEVQEMPFRRLPSHALVDKDWLDLVRTIHQIFDEDKADGVVITHGTNTIEETAYFLNLTLKTDKTVGCWGRNESHQASTADEPFETRPVKREDIANARDIALGEQHVCVLLDPGTGNAVRCWGRDGTGNLETPDLSASTSASWVAIHAAKDVTCVEAADPVTARLGRQHNDANVVAIPERNRGLFGFEGVKQITPFL